MLRKASIIAIAVIFITATAGTVHSAPIKATLTRINGDVHVKMTTGAEWIVAAERMTVGEGVTMVVRRD